MRRRTRLQTRDGHAPHLFGFSESKGLTDLDSFSNPHGSLRYNKALFHICDSAFLSNLTNDCIESMTSTITTTVNLSMTGLQRFKSFKQKNPWPNPERSIGISWCPLGKNWCWEAVGPAQEIAGKILCKIKDILESQQEYLNEGVCIRRVLLFGLYMIGRTKAQARPTIVFSCENKIQRQRAMKAVRESAILDGHPGVCLGESSALQGFLASRNSLVV